MALPTSTRPLVVRLDADEVLKRWREELRPTLEAAADLGTAVAELIAFVPDAASPVVITRPHIDRLAQALERMRFAAGDIIDEAPDAPAQASGGEDDEACPDCGAPMLLHNDSDLGPCTVCPDTGEAA